MTHITEPRVMETCSAPGTGAFTLLGAVAGYQRFDDVMAPSTDTCFYLAEAVDGSGAPNGDWEEGFGTYSATDTLARTTLLNSSTGAAINFTGDVRVFLTFPAFRAAGTDVQEFATPGSSNWINPSPTIRKPVRVRGVAPAQGGGSGRKGTSAAASGGGAGAPGPKFEAWFNSDELPSTVNVTVGAGGTGGPARTTNATSGANGSAGGNHFFGATSTTFYVGVIGAATANGGTTTSGPAGQSRSGYPVTNTTGQWANNSAGAGALTNGGTATNTGTLNTTSGGGGGAGATTATNRNGGNAGSQLVPTAGAASVIPAAVIGGLGGVGSTATPPTAGNSPADPWNGGLGGGGGGFVGGTNTSQAGANGGYPGGSGGGGSGGLDSVVDSGAGGNGGDGWMEVTTYL